MSGLAYASAILTSALAVLPRSSATQADWVDEVRYRVPMIDGTFASGDSERGAGLVVGVEADTVLIATAAHVVERTAGLATAIRIAFLSPRGETFDAVSVVARDSRLDLAVLRLRAPSLAASLKDKPLLCARPPVADERITAIGHRLDDLWQVSSVDNVLTTQFEADTRIFTTSGRGFAKGSSGGPVLGSEGCFVGLVLRASAVQATVVRADQVLAIMKTVGLTPSLLGGDSPLDVRLRRETFDAVSKALNGYVFDLEAVSAMFRRQKWDGDQLAKTIEQYNASYRNMYDGRSAFTAQVASRFGGQRGTEFEALIAVLDGGHKQVIYSQLNDIVTALRARGRLSNSENKQLQGILTLLDGLVSTSKTKVNAFLDALRVLVSAPSTDTVYQGERHEHNSDDSSMHATGGDSVAPGSDARM